MILMRQRWQMMLLQHDPTDRIQNGHAARLLAYAMLVSALRAAIISLTLLRVMPYICLRAKRVCCLYAAFS